MKIKSKYLTVPVNRKAESKKLLFYKTVNGEKKLVFDLDVRLDTKAPDFTAFVDVGRFFDAEIEIEAEPPVEGLAFGTAEEMTFPDLYREELRPMSHFSVKNGWNNDPNGLVYYKGVYHLFYQYNPMAPSWGNMHWGHAVSADLIHWVEKDVALFPDETGTMYSGSGILDAENRTGLGTAENPPLLFFYTAAGGRNRISEGREREQCIAYSVDNGETLIKFAGNPVVPSMAYYNRDPKVVWVPEIEKYVMVLFMKDDRYGLFTSENLLDWTLLQDIHIPGDSECPDFCGFSSGGVNYWALLGAHDKYMIGRFEDGTFVPETEVKAIGTCENNKNYAAQSYSGLTDGRVVRVYWQTLQIPDSRFAGQMGIPTELGLEIKDGEPFLTVSPVREIKTIYSELFVRKTPITDGTTAAFPLKRAAYDLRLCGSVSGEIRVSFFGSTITLSRKDGFVYFGEQKLSPLPEGQFDLRVIVDRCSLEIYVNGIYFNTVFAICDYGKPELTIRGDGFSADEIRIGELENIH